MLLPLTRSRALAWSHLQVAARLAPGSAAPECLRTWPSRRGFAGRASDRRGPNDGEPKPERAEDAGGRGGAAAKSAPAAPGAAREAHGPAQQQPASQAQQAPGLFVLPLYRKPAFPGFYQIVQVSEQGVLDFLFVLKKNGQGDYLGGFMTKALPSKLSEEPSPPPATSPVTAQATSEPAPSGPQSLRRDAGRIADVSELEEVGTVLEVITLSQYPNISGGQVVVMPHKRIRRTRAISEPTQQVALAAVAVEYLEEPEVPEGDEKVKALHLEIIAKMKELLKTSFLYKEQFEHVVRFYDLDHPLKLSDLVAGMSLAARAELQAVLCEDRITERLEKVLAIVNKDLEFARLQSRMKSQVEEKVTTDQRRVMLMEQMRQITKELGIEGDEKQSLVQQFRDVVKDKTLPEEALKVLEAELTKLGTLEPSSSEYNVSRTYLEWLTCLPWGVTTEENKDIRKASQILDEDHYGLEDVKERIMEHMAVSFLKENVQGKIMCMVGPPGVGKTSIGKSIARALDRKFFRMSVGGLSDVSEIRGHRRTYVGAMPGKLIQCLKLTQSANPVVLIDEIDKLGRGMGGDPSSALLEVLDPEQNSAFRDHYLDVPVDLSRVLFVCTANVLDTIPGPLLDRMEVIRLAGYVFEEKVAIANQYLLPQTLATSGIGEGSLELEPEALHKIIGEYAREAGVRQLSKLIEKVSRKVALSMVRKKSEEKEKAVISADNLSDYIGQPLFTSDRLYNAGTPPGVVMGLAWTSMGGAILYIEACGSRPRGGKPPPSAGPSGNPGGATEAGDSKEGSSGASEGGSGAFRGFGGHMRVTGQLGSVMNESSAISLTYARLFCVELDPWSTYLDEARMHLHVPEGAVPKDGPSAGVTMALALVSLALGQPVKSDLAMTGELTLTGKVLKVGGIKEKVIAAKREGATTLLLPRQNEADFAELKEYLRTGVTAHFVDHFDDVYRLAFDAERVPALPFPSRGMPVVTVEAPPLPDQAAESSQATQPAALAG